MGINNMIFAVYAESDEGLKNIYRLAESIRAFAGQFSTAPIWAYIPEDLKLEDDLTLSQLQSLNVEIKTSHTPDDAKWFYYAGKVYAAAQAEAAAEGEASLLVWLDNDTIVLMEPGDFNLQSDKSFAYCPVMHNRSGSLYDTSPDPFWSRIYEKLAIDYEKLAPMITPADQQKIRAYFHIGLLVMRPEKGVLRQLVRDFEVLYKDPVLAEMCRDDINKRVFLHQTALLGVVNLIDADEMLELSERYNYPIFFEKRYGANQQYNSIENTVTIRIVVTSDDMGTDWHKELIGTPEKIAWLKERFE